MRTASGPTEIEVAHRAASVSADVVIGSRFAGKATTGRGPRKWAMNLFSFILARGRTHLVTTSGFKLYGPRALSLFAHNYPAGTYGRHDWCSRHLGPRLVVREVGVNASACGAVSHAQLDQKSALLLVRLRPSPSPSH